MFNKLQTATTHSTRNLTLENTGSPCLGAANTAVLSTSTAGGRLCAGGAPSTFWGDTPPHRTGLFSPGGKHAPLVQQKWLGRRASGTEAGAKARNHGGTGHANIKMDHVCLGAFPLRETAWRPTLWPSGGQDICRKRCIAALVNAQETPERLVADSMRMARV